MFYGLSLFSVCLVQHVSRFKRYRSLQIKKRAYTGINVKNFIFDGPSRWLIQIDIETRIDAQNFIWFDQIAIGEDKWKWTLSIVQYDFTFLSKRDKF